MSHGPIEWTEFEASEFDHPATPEALTERRWYPHVHTPAQPAREPMRELPVYLAGPQAQDAQPRPTRTTGARWGTQMRNAPLF